MLVLSGLFLSFYALVFVGFLLLNKDAFVISHFSVIGLIGIHLAAAFIWSLTKFSYLSFRVCFSDIS